MKHKNRKKSGRSGLFVGNSFYLHFLLIFSRCHSINHLEAFTEMLRILKSGLVCYLGEVVRPLSDQLCRFLQTYVFDELHR